MGIGKANPLYMWLRVVVGDKKRIFLDSSRESTRSDEKERRIAVNVIKEVLFVSCEDNLWDFVIKI